jgi:hypothetical protein
MAEKRRFIIVEIHPQSKVYWKSGLLHFSDRKSGSNSIGFGRSRALSCGHPSFCVEIFEKDAIGYKRDWLVF